MSLKRKVDRLKQDPLVFQVDFSEIPVYLELPKERQERILSEGNFANSDNESRKASSFAH